MGKTKYMMSNGLAFEEAKDMQKLRKKSLQGWNLKRFRFAGYELERGEKRMSSIVLIIGMSIPTRKLNTSSSLLIVAGCMFVRIMRCIYSKHNREQCRFIATENPPLIKSHAKVNLYFYYCPSVLQSLLSLDSWCNSPLVAYKPS